eukprot:286448-Pelagomonas_calceolata.AAC.3
MQKNYLLHDETYSQHFRHADISFTIPKTSIWFMKPVKRGALLGGAEHDSGARTETKSGGEPSLC